MAGLLGGAAEPWAPCYTWRRNARERRFGPARWLAYAWHGPRGPVRVNWTNYPGAEVVAEFHRRTQDLRVAHPRAIRPLYGGWIEVRYPAEAWDRGTAWDDLVRNPVAGVACEANPWRKAHDYEAGAWAWRAPSLP